MSLTTVLVVAFIAWMLFMHLRPGRHGRGGGGCCGGAHHAPEHGGDPDGAH